MNVCIYFNMYRLLLGWKGLNGKIFKSHINELVGDWPEWFKEIGITVIK